MEMTTSTGNIFASLPQSVKPASPESSASEKQEDTGGRCAHHVRASTVHPTALSGFIRAMDDVVLDYDSAYEYISTSSFEFQRGERIAKQLVSPYLSKAAPSKWDDAEKWLVSQSPSESLSKARTKSGPLQGFHSGKKIMVLNHHEWHAHSYPTKNWHSEPVLLAEEDTVLVMDGASRHHKNMKLVNVQHTNQNKFNFPLERTKSTDAVKTSSIAPNLGHSFVFTPVPVPLPKGNHYESYPVSDDLSVTKEVSVSHERHQDGTLMKPMSRTRKPPSDCVVSGPYGSKEPSVRSVSMRDMGTEMTPITSQEPSRTGTPIRATTPTKRSPGSSCMSTPKQGSPMLSPGGLVNRESDGRTSKLDQVHGTKETQPVRSHPPGKTSVVSWTSKEEEDADASKLLKNIDLEEVKKSVLETRAAAWEEAEQSKYMARYKREEAKIIAWENHQKAKAEAELKRIEVKLEKKRALAHEKLMKKLAATQRKAERLHAAAEAKQCEHASKAAHRADYIRRTGRLPVSYFSCGLCHS